MLPKGTPKSSVQLSIALAPCNGTSPGPPVTLELLPAGHCSLPHDNARANGVLRVLHGSLDGTPPPPLDHRLAMASTSEGSSNESQKHQPTCGHPLQGLNQVLKTEAHYSCFTTFAGVVEERSLEM